MNKFFFLLTYSFVVFNTFCLILQSAYSLYILIKYSIKVLSRDLRNPSVRQSGSKRSQLKSELDHTKKDFRSVSRSQPT